MYHRFSARVAQSDVNRFLDLHIRFTYSNCVYAVAECGVADALGEAPETAIEVAARLGLDADAVASCAISPWTTRGGAMRRGGAG